MVDGKGYSWRPFLASLRTPNPSAYSPSARLLGLAIDLRAPRSAAAILVVDA